MITIIYSAQKLKDVYSDDERYMIGQDVIENKIETLTVKDSKELEVIRADMAEDEGTSEGHQRYKILAIFDKETGWYDSRLYEERRC